VSNLNDGFLYVGDMHVQRSNLPESKRLIEWIKQVADKLKLPIVFGGDQYNDHGSQRVEIVEFWVWAFEFLTCPGPDVIALVGNHDMNHEGDASVMVAHHKPGLPVNVVSAPVQLTEACGAVPFYRRNEDFVAAVMTLYNKGARTVLCHQEIDGAQYENGFYAPHGVKVSDLPADIKLISGHIHKQQEFGNVWYPGTPRQLTRSDIGETKGIWVVAFDGRRKFIPTPSEVAEPFQRLSITPENADLVIPNSEKVYADVSGPKEFVLEYAKKLPKVMLAHVRCNPDPDQVVSDVKESDGINVAFAKYLSKYSEAEKLDQDTRDALSSAVYGLCPSLKRAAG
jgi:DNA repair exonuclease SbcCD nuclease subunit